MKKRLSWLLVFSLQGFVIHAAWAQGPQPALVPLPSVDDFTRGQDGWGFGIGLGVEYESAYEGSDEFGFEVEPAGGIQWRQGDDVFYWAGEALGWRGLRANTWLLEASVGFDEGRQERDSKDGRLNGVGDAEESASLVLEARRALDTDWRYWLVGRVVTGSNGHLGLVGVGRRFGDKLDGSGSEINVVAVAHDSRLANQDFGINAAQSLASGLKQTQLAGGWRSWGVNWVYRHHINPNWQVYGEALYERFSSRVQSSPIARSRYEGEIGMGLLYRF